MNKMGLEVKDYSIAESFTGHTGNYVKSNTYWEMHL